MPVASSVALLLGGAALGAVAALVATRWRQRRSPPRGGVDALEHELDRKRRGYQELFDIVPCYISIQDRRFRITESNALFRTDFGDRIGDLCYTAYKGRDDVCPGCPVVKTFDDGEVHHSEEVVRTHDGRQAEMVVYSMPVRDEQGDITSVMEVSTNITRVKDLQRQLVMMGLAVAGMAHRTKNILMGLEGGIFIVNAGLQDGDQDEVKEGWRMVERNVARVSRLVKDLLFCAKERSPTLAPGVEPADVVGEIHELFSARAAEAGVELTLDVREAPPAGTYDATGLRAIMTNLVANALDACRFDTEGQHKRHRISIRCADDGAGATLLEVDDNGAGIPDEVSDQVFRSFFSTKGTEGTGLGLLVVQKVVQEAGGTVTFTSREGEGTTFSAVLPPQAAGQAESAGPGEAG